MLKGLLLLMALVFVVIRLRRHGLRQHSFDCLALLYSAMEDLAKTGILLDPAVRIQVAALEYSCRIAGLQHDNGNYKQARETAAAATAKAQQLLSGNSNSENV